MNIVETVPEILDVMYKIKKNVPPGNIYYIQRHDNLLFTMT